MKKLLIIDPQNCFCKEGASLYVSGAKEDSERLATLLKKQPHLFSSIDISLDMHQKDDVGHPMYWVNDKREHPAPFTQITLQDFLEQKWFPANEKYTAKMSAYLYHLDKEKNFTHTVWPLHAEAGTPDADIVNSLQMALEEWELVNEKSCTKHIKGMDRHSEHYGIFQAEGPNQEFNHKLINELFTEDAEIYVAGQAKSHCVATSLKQILNKYPQFIPQITLISDATSNVGGFEHVADSIYDALEKAGMKTITTEELEKEEVHA